MNTYRWDWLMCLLVSISILLIFFWTGVYSAFTSSDMFYKAAPQVFGAATFWATIFLSVVVSLLPRFAAKTIQKIYYPYDVDIIREQIRQGKFKHLEGPNKGAPLDSDSKGSSAESSDMASPRKQFHQSSFDEDHRPIYPPSVAATATTARHERNSHNGSGDTDYTRNRSSDYDTGVSAYETEMPNPNYDPSSTYATPFEYPATTRTSVDQSHRPSMDQSRPSVDRPRMSLDRPRPSFDRLRSSMDRIRPSFEQASTQHQDFTSAAMLTRVESSHALQQKNSAGRSFPLISNR